MCPSRGRRAQPSSGASRSPPFPLHFPLLLVLIFSLLLPPASAAVATSDLLAYVGGTATGQSLTTLAYTLTMVANETAVLVSCSFDGKASEVGWLGWGVGSAMTDSDIIVLWPTVSGGSLTWTLSHRTASTTAMPTLVGSTSDDPSVDSTGNLKIVPGLSSASGDESPAVVTFERLLSLPDGYEGGKNYQLEASINQGVIYAYGDKNPGDSAQGTDFDQHSLDSMGASYVDLSSSFTADTAAIDAPLTPVKSSGGSSSGASKSSGAGAGGSTGTGSGGGASGTAAAGGASGTGTAAGSSGTGSAGSSSSSTGGTGSSSSSSSEAKKSSFTYAGVILIHGLCAGTAWAVFSPMGVLFARYGRGPPGTTITQFSWHFTMQTWIVSPLTFVALGLALWAVSLKSSASTETYTHRTIGFFFIGALVVQDLLGIFKHMGGPPRPGAGVSILGVCHIILGVTLTAVGFYQVHLGIVRYGGSDLVTYGLYGCIALFTLAYGISALLSLGKRSGPPPPPPHSHRHRKKHRPPPHRRRRSAPRHRKSPSRRRSRQRSRSSDDDSASDSGSTTSYGSSTSSLDSRSTGSEDERNLYSSSGGSSSDEEADRRHRRKRKRGRRR